MKTYEVFFADGSSITVVASSIQDAKNKAKPLSKLTIVRVEPRD